jgi:hypothetical protein
MVMAEQKPNQRQVPREKQGQADASPNPHNESNIIELPVRTDQGDATGGDNVGQSPSTRDGQIHPSVGEAVGGGVADTDSMFNDADPQTSDILSSGGRENSGHSRRDAKKKQA